MVHCEPMRASLSILIWSSETIFDLRANKASDKKVFARCCYCATIHPGNVGRTISPKPAKEENANGKEEISRGSQETGW
jgi:hypothetical protein